MAQWSRWQGLTTKRRDENVSSNVSWVFCLGREYQRGWKWRSLIKSLGLGLDAIWSFNRMERDSGSRRRQCISRNGDALGLSFCWRLSQMSCQRKGPGRTMQCSIVTRASENWDGGSVSIPFCVCNVFMIQVCSGKCRDQFHFSLCSIILWFFSINTEMPLFGSEEQKLFFSLTECL